MVDVARYGTGPIETNTWLVCDGDRRCIVIDPASGCGEITGRIRSEGLECEAVVLTHSHFDHITGIPELLEVSPMIPVYINPIEAAYLANSRLNASLWFGDEFVYTGSTEPLAEGRQRIGHFEFDVRHIPGHSPGGMALVIDKWCFCGDALFAGSIGRSDLPGGDGPALIEGIRGKLLTLPEETVVCPGHGGRTTIGREKKNNPYLV
ncbi:MAG: MBL fold metallo-hydrolase [Chitinispirillaceae bacterium]|nr:MBL fold metallo-hydrolase [Chitinispirillaceae bacterium]